MPLFHHCAHVYMYSQQSIATLHMQLSYAPLTKNHRHHVLVKILSLL